MSRRTCPAKGYGDLGAAIGAAIRVSRHLGPLRVYPCPRCGQHHLSRYREWVER